MTRGALPGASSVRKVVSWVLALGWLFMLGFAHAAESAPTEFSAPAAGCPTQAALNERLAQLADPSVAPKRARVAITESASGYHTEVTLSTGNEARQRTFDTETCAAGVEAAALAIALGSQPEAEPTAPTAPTAIAQPAPSAAAQPLAVGSSSVRREAPPISKSSTRLAVRLIAELGIDAVAMPNVAATGAMGVSLAADERFWIEARALGAFPQDVAAPNGRAHFTLLGGALRGCYLGQPSFVVFGPCLGVGVYRLTGEGREIPQAHTGAQLYGGPSASALGRWTLSPRFGLRASVEGLIAVGRRSFQLDGQPLYTPGRIDFYGALGGDFRF